MLLPEIIPFPDFVLHSLPVITYLEMHYRFRFFPFSRYFRREPEIIADAPHRLQPGQPLPVTVLIKDANRFPILLESVHISGRAAGEILFTLEKSYQQHITAEWFHDLIHIEDQLPPGVVEIIVELGYRCAGRRKKIRTHNVATSPSFNLSVRVGESAWPNDDYYWGDLHYHSNYTEDYVEFGAPLEATKATAAALGLDFVAISDHSYDLDNENGSWTANDPDLKKWRRSRKAIEIANQDGGPRLLPAEEVTVRNCADRNVHLLVFNHPEFIPGSGDGAERWQRVHSEYSIAQVLGRLNPGELALAAHPFAAVAPLERLLLNRGSWQPDDRRLSGLSGYQIINGEWTDATADWIEVWTEELLHGRRKFIYAGNDAHGNFNYFHQIKMPMITTHHHRRQILGKWRTGVLKTGPLSVNQILSALRQGRCIISDGPVIKLKVQQEREYNLGDTVPAGKFDWLCRCTSTEEFGSLQQVQLFHGSLQSHTERLIFSRSWERTVFDDSCQQTGNQPLDSGYLRAELITRAGHRCLTNPIWIEDE